MFIFIGGSDYPLAPPTPGERLCILSCPALLLLWMAAVTQDWSWLTEGSLGMTLFLAMPISFFVAVGAIVKASLRGQRQRDRRS